MVKIVKTGTDEAGLPIFVATEVDSGEPVSVKNWFEKSKNKWHIVLGPNSANRKYIAHNEFNANAKEEDGLMRVKSREIAQELLEIGFLE